MASTLKVAVVTGGNKGIGFEIARRLCKQFDGTTILTARNEQLGKEAVEKLKSEGFNPQFHQLDITSKESISNLKAHLEKTYGGLDLLINNAGIAYKNASTAPFAEQAEVTCRTNFTGTLDVSNGLFPLLRPHARVVHVASSSGHLKRIPSQEIRDRFTSLSLTEAQLIDLMAEFVRFAKEGIHEQKGWLNSGYGISKVGVIALGKVQARQMSQDPRQDILINSCCPGWVQTDMAGPNAPLTVDQGAETPLLVAFLPEGCGHAGEFFYDKKVTEW